MPNRINIHVAQAHQADHRRRADARRRIQPEPERPPDGGSTAPAAREAAVAAVRRARRRLARQVTA